MSNNILLNLQDLTKIISPNGTDVIDNLDLQTFLDTAGLKLDGSNAMAADINVNNNQIINLPNASQADHAINKAQHDVALDQQQCIAQVFGSMVYGENERIALSATDKTMSIPAFKHFRQSINASGSVDRWLKTSTTQTQFYIVQSQTQITASKQSDLNVTVTGDAQTIPNDKYVNLPVYQDPATSDVYIQRNKSLTYVYDTFTEAVLNFKMVEQKLSKHAQLANYSKIGYIVYKVGSVNLSDSMFVPENEWVQ